jgi:hypothetical protein
MLRRARLLAAGLVAAIAAVVPAEVATAQKTSTQAELKAFADEADVVCVRAAAAFLRLEDPDGVGGAKPLGTGALMQKFIAQLARLDAPKSIENDWRRMLGLLHRAGQRLEDSERLAAQGRLRASGRAQGEALWDLEARAGKIRQRLDVPFRVCWVE